MPRIPVVMVSSTFYDLKQLRQNLSTFIGSELGWKPLLSEHNSFPVDPDADTIENCRRRVEKDADILVLVVGGRYGSIDESSKKSITNLEYLAARAKGIPIYVFVSKGILPLVPVWERNQDADFSSSVDNPALFEFVRQIRTVHKAWVHEFEYADDIIVTLRQQFAFLVADWMQKVAAFRGKPIENLAGLSSEALRIALEEPPAWEYLLFFTVLRDEVNARRDLRREYELNFAVGQGTYIEDARLSDWLQAQIAQLLQITDVLMRLVNDEFAIATGPRGQSGDRDQIIFVAKRMGMIYERALQWSQDLRSMHVNERFRPVLVELARYSRSHITSIERVAFNYIDTLRDDISRALAGESREITIDFVLDVENSEAFVQAVERAYKQPYK